MFFTNSTWGNLKKSWVIHRYHEILIEKHQISLFYLAIIPFTIVLWTSTIWVATQIIQPG